MENIELYPNDGWLENVLPKGEDALYSMTLDTPRELTAVVSKNDDGSARLCFHSPVSFFILGRRLMLRINDLSEATFTCCNILRCGTFSLNIMPRRIKSGLSRFAVRNDMETRFPERLGLETDKAVAVEAPVLNQAFMCVECDEASVEETDFKRINVSSFVRRIYADETCVQEYNYMFSPDGYLKTLRSALGRPLPELGFTNNGAYIYLDR